MVTVNSEDLIVLKSELKDVQNPVEIKNLFFKRILTQTGCSTQIFSKHAE